MPFDLDARIADWRKSLLDTTKRNRLIKFVAGRIGGVNLIHPPATDLWTRLVHGGDTLTFPWKQELLGLPHETLDADIMAADEGKIVNFCEEHQREIVDSDKPTVDVDPIRVAAETNTGELSQKRTTQCLLSKKLLSTHVLTEFTDRQLVARLIRLSRSAKEAETDHGVTTLYAAFGFLRWFEKEDSDEAILSPMLLVPVRLGRETIESPFTLRASEDDVLPNHCLAELLESQFKIKLPTHAECALDPENPDCFTGYLQAVKERIKDTARWSVIETSAIGVFNFQKLAMWEDLGRNIERIKTHSLCRAVAGDSAAFRAPPEGLPAATDLDRVVAPSAMVHILDADSSQHEAIEAVKCGADLVLDGPPGTGKSQTIANMIAETLAAGKTVLFVSAKIAALEVVKRRLDKCGLGDFCLELYSHKANKKEVVTELGRCLDLTPESMPDVVAQLQELADNRSKLNEFVVELHAVRWPLGWSAYRVHGELARIEAIRDRLNRHGQSSGERVVGRSRISIAEPLAKNTDYVRKGCDILAGLADYHAVINTMGGHPWWGCKLTTFTHTVRDDAAYSLSQFASAIRMALQAAEALAEAGFAAASLTIPDWRNAEANAQRVLAAPIFPLEWFRADARATAEALIEINRATRETREHERQLLEFDPSAVRTIKNSDEVTMNLDRERLVLAAILPARDRLATLTRIQVALLTLREQTKAVDSLGRGVAQQLRLGAAPLFRELGSLASVAGRVAQKPSIPLSWWDAIRRSELLAVVTRAGEDELSAQARRPTLVTKFSPAALTQESSPLAREAADAARSPWRWLPWSQWAKKRKSVEGWYPTNIPDGAAIRTDIAELATYHRSIDAAWQVATAYAAELASDTNGKTDWTATATGLKDIEQLGKWNVAADLKVMTGPSGKLDRKKLQSSAENLDKAVKAFDESWMAVLKELAITDPTSILSKSSSEVLGWLETEITAIKKEAIALARVVGLLAAGKDVPAAVLRERTSRLRQLVAARSQIESSASILQETRSTEALEAIDHSDNAVVASSLLAFLTAWARPLTPGVIAALSDRGARERLDAFVRNSAAAHPGFDKAWNRITTDLFDPDTMVSTNLVLTNTPLTVLKKWADDRMDDVDRLTEWARFLQMEKDAHAYGVGGIIEEVKAGEYGPTDAANAFRARFYRLWLDALHQQVPTLGSFASATQERLIARFAELDRLLIRSTPARVRTELLMNSERPQPREGAPETSELGILLREVHKKRRHLPLRRLFTQIPWVLPRLKPCLMMSPLAVSTFLDTPELFFDLVIFDEASQVRPHDAICAIYRGRQLVVGGDPKQLPPTDFFNRTDDDDDTSKDEGAISSYESLLDVCLSRGLTRKWLRWHYRSQRESLIAFSNRFVYENRLVTFPSADEATGPAITFVKVPDGRFKDGVNPIEARRVAILVMEHARTTPDQTLGIIAFSQRQQDRILDELEILRRQNATTETFFADDSAEPFFVKNLENVQGDERDVIFLDVGYGPDEAGKVAMRFGPLNQQGGERRLNVAITRARRAMTVVSSITAADIDLSRARSLSAKLLRAFLDYAERGPVAFGEMIDSVQGEAESPFEQEVGDELVRRGLSIQRQVGCGGYRIDLAITDSQQDGKYLLGIECDGATYHAAATARDRDRLRQAVLEGLGWRLVRVWSTDWVRDREKQVKRILAALKDAKNPKPTPPARDSEFKTSPVSKKRSPKLTEYEDIEAVPDSALTDAIVATLIAFGSIPAEELSSAVSKRLGFKRTGPKIRDRIIGTVNDLVAAGHLVLSEESRVRLSPQNARKQR